MPSPRPIINVRISSKMLASIMAEVAPLTIASVKRRQVVGQVRRLDLSMRLLARRVPSARIVSAGKMPDRAIRKMVNGIFEIEAFWTLKAVPIAATAMYSARKSQKAGNLNVADGFLRKSERI